MDTPLPSPQSLGDIYNMNPGAFGQAQGIINMGQQGADLSQMMNQQTYDQNAVMNPLRAQSMQASNDAAAAGLPGIVAGSAQKVRQNSNEALTNDAHIKDVLGKLSQEDRQRHIQDIDDAGMIFRQQGALAFANPIGAAQRVKQELTNAGHADMWNPDWEKLNPGQLATALSETGNDIGKTSSKMLQLSAGIDAKKDLAISVEKSKQEGRVALRNNINESAQAIEAARQAGQNGRVKMSSDQAAVQYTKLADQAEQAGDSQLAQALRSRADQATQRAMAERAAGTEAGNTAKPDIEALTDGAVPTLKKPAAMVTPPFKPGVSASGPLPIGPQDTPAPGAPAEAPGATSSVPQMVIKAFGAFEPERYDYRMSPEGKLQRKMKPNVAAVGG